MFLQNAYIKAIYTYTKAGLPLCVFFKVCFDFFSYYGDRVSVLSSGWHGTCSIAHSSLAFVVLVPQSLDVGVAAGPLCFSRLLHRPVVLYGGGKVSPVHQLCYKVTALLTPNTV